MGYAVENRSGKPRSPQGRADALDMVVTTLNVPVGPIVSRESLAMAFREGLGAVVSAHGERPAAIIAGIFIECSPMAIASASIAAGCDLMAAERLYVDAMKMGGHRNPGWERETSGFIDRGPRP